MNIRDVDSTTRVTDFENFFDVYKDDDKLRFNLNSTLILDISDDNLLKYTLRTDAFWPLISYQLYGTTRLAWMLMKINDVKGDEIFKKKHPGDIIYYISTDDVKKVLTYIS